MSAVLQITGGDGIIVPSATAARYKAQKWNGCGGKKKNVLLFVIVEKIAQNASHLLLFPPDGRAEMKTSGTCCNVQFALITGGIFSHS